MVKKIFSAFRATLSREVAGLHEAAYLLAASSLLSQILALFRDRLLASVFGATTSLDLYYSAFRIPDLIFATIGSLVSASVILPFFIERQSKSHDDAKEFLSSMFHFYFLTIAVVSGIVFMFAPFLLGKLFPVFAARADFGTLILMTRILLLSPIFLGLSNLFSTVTQSYRRFFIYSLSPILYNVGIIAGILFFRPIFGLPGLAIGVACGAFLHFCVQIPFAVKKGFWPEFITPKSLVKRFDTIKKASLISIPRTITVSSNELAELFLISFASFLIPGSISVFNFSFNLQSVPFAIIGISYSMAAFPTLARHIGNGAKELFVEEMVTSSRHIIFWSVPITTLFVVLRAQIVRVILGAGRFDWNDTRLTAAALALFTVSLLAQNMSHLFVRSYYSRGKTAPPLIINLISATLIVVLSYVFVQIFNNVAFFHYFVDSLLKVEDIPGTVILMLPLGYTIGVTINMILHWADFHREFKTYSRRVLRSLFEISGASLIMGWTSYMFLKFFDNLFDIHTLLGIFAQGFFSGLIGVIAGIVVLVFLKNAELAEVWKTLHGKIWKAKVVGPDANTQ